MKFLGKSFSQQHMVLYAVLFMGAYLMPCYAQPSFSENSHWSPRFGPPALFVNPYNLGVTEEYVLVSGQRYEANRVEVAYGTVYQAAPGGEIQHLNISGWEDAMIVAGAHRVFARRGRDDGELAELDLVASIAHHIPNPPASGPLYTTFGDTLYALAPTGGSVHRWNDAVWEPLGPPLDLEIDAWTIGVSGVFAAVGPGTICNPQDCTTALWQLIDGRWMEIGVAKGTGNPPVSGIAVDPQGRLVIAGDFSAINDVPVWRAARWDGTTWSPLGHGLDPDIGFITALVTVDTLIYAAGTENRVLQWNGAAWTALEGHPDDFVRRLVSRQGRLFASGWFTAIGDTVTYRVAEWNTLTERWLPVFPVMGGGIDGEVRSLVVGPDGSLFAGGLFAAAGDVRVRNVARWNGTGWQRIGEGTAKPVDALATSMARLYAGTNSGIQQANLSNLSWSDISDLPDGRALSYVEDLLMHRDTLYAAARAGTYPSHTQGVFRWTGAAWETLGEVWSEEDPGTVLSLTLDAHSTLYAAGMFTRIGNVEARNIARWDGTGWHALGDGLPYPAKAVEAGGGTVYAGGQSDSLYVWHTANQTWSGIPLPHGDNQGCDPEIRTLLWRPDGLYAGGRMTCILTKTETAYDAGFTLARWNGEIWQVPGSGIAAGEVKALAAQDDDLYVAGFFHEAGDRPSANIAHWNANIRLPIATPEPSTTALYQNYPNPFGPSTTIHFSLDHPAEHARLEVFDLLGRPVALLLDGPLVAGTHNVAFNAKGLAGGLYLYRLSAGGHVWSRKMLLVR